MAGLGVVLTLISARRWNEGGRRVSLRDGLTDSERTGAEGLTVVGAATIGRHPFGFLFDPRPVWRALRDRPDLIDLHEEPASVVVAEVLLLRWLTGRSSVPLVLYSAQNLAKRYPVPFRWIERAALRRAAAVHSCNGAVADVLSAKGFTGVVTDLGLGVDGEHYRPGPEREPQQRTGGRTPLRVGFAGRLESRKGIDVLVDAVSRMSEVQLEIVGDGPLAPELARRIEAAGVADRIHLRGFLDHDELAQFYRSCELVVVPSRSTPGWVEQFGRVAVEAMACGVPVVVTDSGALPEVVGDAGIVVGEESDDALRDALMEILRRASDDRDWLARCATSARAQAMRYSWSSIVRRQVALYETVLGTSAPSPVDGTS